MTAMKEMKAMNTGALTTAGAYSSVAETIRHDSYEGNESDRYRCIDNCRGIQCSEGERPRGRPILSLASPLMKEMKTIDTGALTTAEAYSSVTEGLD